MKAIKLTCPECGKEFETDNHRRKYCSPECCKEFHKKRTRQRIKENPNYYQELKERRKRKNLESAISRCRRHFNNCETCPYDECRFEEYD